MGVGGAWVKLLGVSGGTNSLFLFYVDVSGMCLQSRLSPPTFDNTGSLGSPPHQLVYPPGSNLDD